MLTIVFLAALLAGLGGLYLQFSTIRDGYVRMTGRDWIAEGVLTAFCVCVVLTAAHSILGRWGWL